MKTKYSLFLLTLLLWLQVYPVQSQQVVFNKVLAPEGMNFQHVTGIVQDKLGYMWLATQQGLYRYDGYTFLLYKNDPLNPNSLASNYLNCVSSDSSGMIWIGTADAGLEKLDPFTGAFMHFRHTPNHPASLSNDFVTSVLQDREGTIWIGTKDGLNQYDSRLGNFILYRNHADDSTSLSCNLVQALYEDHQGTLWIGTGDPYSDGVSEEGGLNRLDKKTGRFIRYLHDPMNPHSLINNKVVSLFEDSKGNFWVGTAGDGLHAMDRQRGTFIRYPYNPAHPEKLSRPPITKIDFRTDWIAFIREDATGGLWIGTTESGINYYDFKTQRVTHYESNKDTTGAFTDKRAWWAYTSREGVLWISTINGSLYRIDPFFRTIPHFASPGPVIESFLKEAGVMWIGTLDGLFWKDLTTGTLKKYTHDPLNPTSLSHNYIQYLKKDSKGNIWLATLRGGLNLFNKRNKTFIHYRHDAKNRSSLSNDYVHFIYEDPEARLWVATAMGLNLMDRKTGTFSSYFIDPKDTVPYSKNFTTYVLKDLQGNLWVGSWFGLYQLNAQTGKFKEYLTGISTFCIYQDAQGNLWVGANNGLYRYSWTSDKFSRFVDSSLQTSMPYAISIAEDNQRNLWICSRDGLVKLNQKRNETRVYGINYGVKGEDFELTYCYKDPTGCLYFSDQTGYFSFYPEQLAKNTKPPEIAITSFYLANEVVHPGKQSPLKEPLVQTKEIRLNYDQNTFSFDVAAFDYSNPQGNHHFFLLDDYDHDWRSAGAERRAYYVNVPPGRYTFRIKVANSYGNWAQKSIVIIITPPWWRSWWFYVLCILVLTAAIYTLFQYRLQQKLKAYELRNTISRDLHDEVGSTLSSIRFLSAMALDGADGREQKTQHTLSNINESANKMLEAMNDIIWNIQPQNDALEHMIPRMVSFASELLEAQKMILHCHIGDNVKQLHLPLAVRHDFLLIFKEAINNLAKYSGASEATIHLEYKHPFLTLTISDNGKGFDPETVKKGNGLNNMQSRAKKIGASFQMCTGIGKGTAITLQVKPT